MPFLILAGPFSSKNIFLQFFNFFQLASMVSSRQFTLEFTPPSHSSPFRPIFPNFRRLPAAGRLANDRSEMEFGTAHGGHNERCGCIHYSHFIDQFWLFWSVHFPSAFSPFYAHISALGYFLSPTPAVGDFCILTAVGVAMDYCMTDLAIRRIFLQFLTFFQSIKSPFLLQLWSTGE
jgi:hypothetical protein